MKNKLVDLNNHLFAALERLGDEELNEEQLKLEIGRSKAMSAVAREIVANASLALEVEKAVKEGFIGDKSPAMLGHEK